MNRCTYAAGEERVPALAALAPQDEQAQAEDHQEDNRHEHTHEGAGDEGQNLKESHRQRPRLGR